MRRVESRFRSRACLRHWQVACGGGSDLAPFLRVDGLDMQAGPVDELLDVSVERPAVDQL